MKIFFQSNGGSAPTKANPTDAGWDLTADHDTELEPGVATSVDTGLRVAIPEGYYGLVSGRSGLNFKYNVVATQEGTIDAGYRGNIMVRLGNIGEHTYTIRKGDRIAQMTFHRVPDVEWEEALVLPDASRSANGFGSSGK